MYILKFYFISKVWCPKWRCRLQNLCFDLAENWIMTAWNNFHQDMVNRCHGGIIKSWCSFKTKWDHYAINHIEILSFPVKFSFIYLRNGNSFGSVSQIQQRFKKIMLSLYKIIGTDHGNLIKKKYTLILCSTKVGQTFSAYLSTFTFEPGESYIHFCCLQLFYLQSQIQTIHQ